MMMKFNHCHTLYLIVIAFYNLGCYSYVHLTTSLFQPKLKQSLNAIPIPKDVVFTPLDFEISRILGKIDITSLDSLKAKSSKAKDAEVESESNEDISGIMSLLQLSGSSGDSDSEDGNNRVASVRVYEGFLQGRRVYLKEFFARIGSPFGKNELSISRKLIARWNRILLEDSEESNKRKRTSVYKDFYPPFPRLAGSMISDESIESIEFRQQWRKRFPRVKPPTSGNLWLAFEWDDNTFRTLRIFPSLPQTVEGLDYFRKDERIRKRWIFIRKTVRKVIETVDFFHSSGYAHNAINIQSFWMSTTQQQKIDSISIQLTDVGAARKLSDDLMYSRLEIIEDYYQLSFVLLEFIISSFNDDNLGARRVRDILG